MYPMISCVEELDESAEVLAEVKRELDAAMSGDKTGIDQTSSTVSIPYSAKLLRMNNRLERAVRIRTRILICLAILAAVLVSLLFVKESELRRSRTAPDRTPEQTAVPEKTASSSPSDPAPAAGPAENEQSTAPEQTPGGGS